MKKNVEFCIRGETSADDFLKKSDQYDHVTIDVFITESTAIDRGMTEETFVLTYQRNKEPDPATHQMKVTYWYGERFTMGGRPLSGELYEIEKLFRRMENYQQRLYDKNLALDIPEKRDALQTRIALLKAVGVSQIYYSRHKHAYFGSQYEANLPKEQEA